VASEGVVLEIFGEGKTDIGDSGATSQPGPPDKGVVPILVHKLCGRPPDMLVKRKGLIFLQGKGLWQKVKFAKRNARCNGSAGVVFVVDSEGGSKELKEKTAALAKGRDSACLGFPMATGVAHPCIEAWLLADALAIRRAMELPATPDLPESPEGLPAPCRDRNRNPKTELARAAGVADRLLSANEQDAIAAGINDLAVIGIRCPLGFAPFAADVERQIGPLFRRGPHIES
jgi:hypothetical protein